MENPFIEMSELEKGLKECFLRRNDLKGKVLSPEEMTEYIAWMHRNYGASANVEALALPHMMKGGEITKLREAFQKSTRKISAFEKLSFLYDVSRETSVFSENADITVTQSLRYMPANWHTNTYFEVYYAISGNCPVLFESETVTLTEGDVLLIPPNIIHANECLQDNCVLIDIMVRSSTFQEVFLSHLTTDNLMALFFRKVLEGENKILYLKFNTKQDDTLKDLVLSVYNEYKFPNCYTSPMLNALVNVFFLRILQKHENTAQLSHHNGLHWKPEFNRMFRYIQENFQTVTIDAIAEKVGYSRRQIIRIVQNCTGMSFSQLTTKLKMEQAVRMLKAGCFAYEVAEKVGYETLSSFYRAFKTHFNCTPAKYLKQ